MVRLLRKLYTSPFLFFFFCSANEDKKLERTDCERQVQGSRSSISGNWFHAPWFTTEPAQNLAFGVKIQRIQPHRSFYLNCRHVLPLLLPVNGVQNPRISIFIGEKRESVIFWSFGHVTISIQIQIYPIIFNRYYNPRYNFIISTL